MMLQHNRDPSKITSSSDAAAQQESPFCICCCNTNYPSKILFHLMLRHNKILLHLILAATHTRSFLFFIIIII
jgi:hypothetical protein